MKRLVVLALVVFPTVARADDIPCDAVEAGAVRVDGLLDDWEGVRGLTVGDGNPDLSFTARCGYDATTIYFAVDVRDDYFARTRAGHPAEDHVELAALDKGRVDRLLVYPADEAAGVKRIVRWASGRPVRGVTVAESRQPRGWSVELAVAKKALPEWTPDAPQLHDAIAVVDSDSKSAPTEKGRLETAPFAPDQLGTLTFAEVRSALDAFLADRGLGLKDVRFDKVARVGAGGARARLVIAGRVLAIVSDEYVWVELPVEKPADLLDVKVVDLAGDGRDAALVRYVERGGGGSREVLGVYCLTDEGLRRTFAIEVAKAQGANRLATRTSLVRRGRATDIVVEALPPTGWTEATYQETPAEDVAPIPLPWSKARRVRFGFKGATYSQLE